MNTTLQGHLPALQLKSVEGTTAVKLTLNQHSDSLQQTFYFQFLQGPSRYMHFGDKVSVFILGFLLPLKLPDRITAVLVTNTRLLRSISQKSKGVRLSFYSQYTFCMENYTKRTLSLQY